MNVSFVMVESGKRGLRDLLLLDGVCWVGFSGSCRWIVAQWGLPDNGSCIMRNNHREGYYYHSESERCH